ncbi:MAG TPA: hypothetical protein VL947_01300, partial [Cytophagales bacterium]|nr:hypothetical protein [Cytophagales bacterium]
MSEILGTWYFPHLLQEDPRVEYIKFNDKGEYIYNDGLGRLESSYTIKAPGVLSIKQPSSKLAEYQYEVSQSNNKTL